MPTLFFSLVISIEMGLLGDSRCDEFCFYLNCTTHECLSKKLALVEMAEAELVVAQRAQPVVEVVVPWSTPLHHGAGGELGQQEYASCLNNNAANWAWR
jgi:hypothetical protein